MTSRQLKRLDVITRELAELAKDNYTTHAQRGHLADAVLALDTIIHDATSYTPTHNPDSPEAPDDK